MVKCPRVILVSERYARISVLKRAEHRIYIFFFLCFYFSVGDLFLLLVIVKRGRILIALIVEECSLRLRNFFHKEAALPWRERGAGFDQVKLGAAIEAEHGSAVAAEAIDYLSSSSSRSLGFRRNSPCSIGR